MPPVIRLSSTSRCNQACASAARGLSRRRGSMNHTITSESQPVSKPPVSERKASANRANAQRSTGPRTAAGKARSSLNALRHGILAKAAFNLKIDGAECRAEFEAIVAGLAQEFQPRTMSDHLMVQQLAGCYWRLAKVWRYEQEAAWRMWKAPGMPIEEYNEFHDDEEFVGFPIRDRLVEEACKFLPSAGLDSPTIPNGASARTVLRYQSAVSSMLFRTQAILERRRKERMASGEPFEEVDYINEPSAEASAPPKASQPAASPEKLAEPAKEAESHKRTQKDPADAPVSSKGDAKANKPEALGEQIAPETAPRNS